MIPFDEFVQPRMEIATHQGKPAKGLLLRTSSWGIEFLPDDETEAVWLSYRWIVAARVLPVAK